MKSRYKKVKFFKIYYSDKIAYIHSELDDGSQAPA